MDEIRVDMMEPENMRVRQCIQCVGHGAKEIIEGFHWANLIGYISNFKKSDYYYYCRQKAGIYKLLITD